jgi:hypothetical protein
LEILGSMVAWFLAKKMCRSLRNSILLLSLDFMPPDQISNMSLNGLRRRVATHDKNQTKNWMEKPSVALDPRHWFMLVGPLYYNFVSQKEFVGGYLGLGFFSTRHSANSEQEVDFQEPYFRWLWVVWSHGTLIKQTFRRLWNFVMLLYLDFMPLDQIANMSLNGLTRRVSSR